MTKKMQHEENTFTCSFDGSLCGILAAQFGLTQPEYKNGIPCNLVTILLGTIFSVNVNLYFE